MIRVRVLGDSAAAIAELEAMLRRSPGVTVVGEVEDTQAADGRGWAAEADVVLVEVEPHGASLAAPGSLLAALPLEVSGQPSAPAVVVLVETAGPAEVARALRGGVRAVLPHSAAEEQILAAVEAAAAGLVSLPADLAESLLGTVPRAAWPGGARRPPTPAVLTPREREVLRLLAEGRGNKGIAARLGISTYTVKAHVSSVFAKLGASSRAEAVAIGARRGVVLL